MKSTLILAFTLLTLGFGVEAIAYDYEAERKACYEGHARVCYILGMRYWGVEDKPLKAKKYFREACDGEYWLGCNMFGHLEYVDGNVDVAATVLVKSCYVGGNAQGCFFLGNLEAQRGNVDAARKAYKKSCDGGHDLACDMI